MNMLKKILILFILGLLVVPVLSCRNESSEAELPETQIVVVQRGDLTVDITAVGNLALSRTEDLAFDLFFQEGTVEAVLVEEGDTVAEGPVLAKLDTSEWEEQLNALGDQVTASERQVTAKERDLLQAQINLETSAQNLKNARGDEETKELALLNKQISLDQANYNLSVAEQTYTWPDIEIAEADIEKAEAFLQYALDGAAESSDSTWDRLVTRAQADLDAAQRIYDALVVGFDTEEVAIKKKQVASAEMAFAQSQVDLNNVAADVSLKELQVELSTGKTADALTAIKDAQKALVDAQEEMEEAERKSPIIVAPFAGFITVVNVEGGDEVLSGTVAVQLADPEKFEADIMISEIDILQVKVGGEAWVQVDAMPGMSLPAKVTHISPTATIQSGVVNYKVKVAITSPEAIMKERQVSRPERRQGLPPGELPERLLQAIEEGRLTREQAAEMMRTGQGGQPLPPEQIPTTIHEGFQLREGLTVTVNIIVEERYDVLLVPNAAVIHQAGRNYVKVISVDGVTEERTVQTGIADWQFTEVTGGLSEGEQIIVPQGTATVITQQEPRRGRASFLPPPH